MQPCQGGKSLTMLTAVEFASANKNFPFQRIISLLTAPLSRLTRSRDFPILPPLKKQLLVNITHSCINFAPNLRLVLLFEYKEGFSASTQDFSKSEFQKSDV